ncbi:MAG TPA: hypothetical protein DD435_10480 [Cyanobacteria bacterium UBA8530]|nr:hypothetical protein [Cyanobacteria bacterium UBA8530]
MVEGILTVEGTDRLFTVGPGFTWNVAEGKALMLGLQTPVFARSGSQAEPLFGILQLSQDF